MIGENHIQFHFLPNLYFEAIVTVQGTLVNTPKHLQGKGLPEQANSTTICLRHQRYFCMKPMLNREGLQSPNDYTMCPCLAPAGTSILIVMNIRRKLLEAFNHPHDPYSLRLSFFQNRSTIKLSSNSTITRSEFLETV